MTSISSRRHFSSHGDNAALVAANDDDDEGRIEKRPPYTMLKPSLYGRPAKGRPDVSPIQRRPQSHDSLKAQCRPRSYSGVKTTREVRRRHLTSKNVYRNDPPGCLHSSKETSVLGKDSTTIENQRKRLLETPDWAGLRLSYPANVHFDTGEAKADIGKRKKIENLSTRMRPQIHHTDHHSSPKFAHRAERIDAKDIRIRIGTDALASQTPMQLTDHAPSHAGTFAPGNSPEPMLFDEEGHYAPTLESRLSPRSVNVNRDGSTEVPNKDLTFGLQGPVPAPGELTPAFMSNMKLRRGPYATRRVQLNSDSEAQRSPSNARPSQDASSPHGSYTKPFEHNMRLMHVSLDQQSDVPDRTTLQEEHTIEQQLPSNSCAQQSKLTSAPSVGNWKAINVSNCETSTHRDDLRATGSYDNRCSRNNAALWTQNLDIGNDDGSISSHPRNSIIGNCERHHGSSPGLDGSMSVPMKIGLRHIGPVTPIQAITSSYGGASSPSTKSLKEAVVEGFLLQPERISKKSHDIDASVQLWRKFVFSDDNNLSADIMRD
ncbi:hypothetical protein BU24DRAFT_463551 [Aaosphaeria arxii CBS 175.79]|uniref:Uncharacterized protein n=1 Tax=Aaosphaeria arxii CBS 175.79 TaxID=1450172 RepID=A0A6A5XR64_9PLEO|nr:uncharacterized protein BU24DRAFT_463551 [Aaosphaeria arxii CBS 175.79]KAF2014794.1 hypothetical protein BU24DRAFT_463551 [Aaosphaeria arxii CBS 175.79]